MYNNEKLSKEEIINLMSVYLDEWKHRDLSFWTQTYRYFYATLIVILLPNIGSIFEIRLAFSVGDKIFPLVGIFMSIFFMYFSVVSGIKSTLASNAYRQLISYIPKDYREKCVAEQRHGKYYNIKMAIALPIFMFSVLIVISLILIFL